MENKNRLTAHRFTHPTVDAVKKGEPVPKLIDYALNAHGFGTDLSRRLLENPVKNPVFPVNPRKLFQKLKFWNSLKGKYRILIRNYRCKDCGRQFIRDPERTYRGTLSGVKNMIKIMSVRGVGIRDVGIILEISITTVLKVLKSTKYKIKPKQTHYD